MNIKYGIVFHIIIIPPCLSISSDCMFRFFLSFHKVKILKCIFWYMNIFMYFCLLSWEVELLVPNINTPKVFYSHWHGALKKGYTIGLFCFFLSKPFIEVWHHTKMSFQQTNSWSVDNYYINQETECYQHPRISLIPSSVTVL